MLTGAVPRDGLVALAQSVVWIVDGDVGARYRLRF